MRTGLTQQVAQVGQSKLPLWMGTMPAISCAFISLSDLTLDMGLTPCRAGNSTGADIRTVLPR